MAQDVGGSEEGRCVSLQGETLEARCICDRLSLDAVLDSVLAVQSPALMHKNKRTAVTEEARKNKYPRSATYHSSAFKRVGVPSTSHTLEHFQWLVLTATTIWSLVVFTTTVTRFSP